jgi:hypothetical protein
VFEVIQRHQRPGCLEFVVVIAVAPLTSPYLAARPCLSGAMEDTDVIGKFRFVIQRGQLRS